MKTVDVHLNSNLVGMTTSATLEINERSNALREAGKQVYKFGLGQSPFPVPEVVIEQLRKHAGEKDYLPVKGLSTLRTAVAAYYERRLGVASSAEDVLIGPGSKELLFLLQFSFAGDLLVPAPSWVSYEPQARLLGSRVHWLPTTLKDRWILRPEAIEAVASESPERPRLLILNYPSNPTGQTWAESDIMALADVARKHGILILSDEIYGELDFEGRANSIAQHYPEGTIISGGISKWAGAGGWRLGAFVFPTALRWLLNAMSVVASETYTSVSAPIQHAAVKAFEGDPTINEYLWHCRLILKHVGAIVCKSLRSVGIDVHDMEGGFYIYPDFSSLKDALGKAGIHSSTEMCRRLLDDTGVAILPGSSFGRDEGELTARLALVNFDGGAALKAAAKQKIDEEFVRNYCADTVKAGELMAEWIVSMRSAK